MNEEIKAWLYFFTLVAIVAIVISCSTAYTMTHEQKTEAINVIRGVKEMSEPERREFRKIIAE